MLVQAEVVALIVVLVRIEQQFVSQVLHVSPCLVLDVVGVTVKL